MFTPEVLAAIAATLKIGGTLLSAVSAERQATLSEINLRRQEAVAKAQGAQAAIKQDEQMSKILSAQNVQAVAQGTTVGSFSAITINSLRNFAEDRKNLNTNLRMKEDILESQKEEIKSQKRMIPIAAGIKIGETLVQAAAVSQMPETGAQGTQQQSVVSQLYANLLGTN